MLVLCYGIPKSGSTLAFEIVKRMLITAGHEQEIFWNDRKDPEQLDPRRGRNFIEGVTRHKLIRIIETIGPSRIIAAKTHSSFPDEMFPWLEKAQALKQLQVVASYRDPRDICLSLVDSSQKARERGRGAFSRVEGLEHAARKIKKRTEEFQKWGALRGTLALNYEMVAFSPDRAIDMLESTLAIKCDREEVKRYAFQEARTQKNKAKNNRHEEELSEAQNAWMLEMFGEFIDRVCKAEDRQWFEERRTELLA